MECIIALDVGGSSVKSAVVLAADRTNFVATTTPINSRGDKDTILNTLTQIIQRHLLEVQQRGWACLGIGIGFPGPFDYTNGVALIRGVKKYEAIYGVNIRDNLQNCFDGRALPMKFKNDAVCALIAEARYGEGKLHGRILGIVLGTGMGSAFLVRGEQVMTGRGIPSYGYLYAEPFAGSAADDVFSTRGLQARLCRATEETSIPLAAQRARAGDVNLLAIFAEFGRDLGTFLTPHATEFRADALILLGGIAHTGDLFAETLRQYLPIPCYKSSLGDKAGIIGASLLV